MSELCYGDVLAGELKPLSVEEEQEVLAVLRNQDAVLGLRIVVRLALTLSELRNNQKTPEEVLLTLAKHSRLDMGD